mgnify:CR=1 FL=1
MSVVKDYILGLYEKESRLDGRKFDEFRKVEVEYGISPKSAEGSARVRIGNTEVVAGVKMDVGQPYPDNPDEALCFDMLSPVGTEIIGGSVRSMDVEDMQKRLAADGEDIKSYEWYMDLRKYGSVPHAGYGIGIERVIAWICGLDNIKDAIPFPRTMGRFTP